MSDPINQDNSGNDPWSAYFGTTDWAQEDAEFGLGYLDQPASDDPQSVPVDGSLSVEGERARIDNLELNSDLSSTSRDELQSLERKLLYASSLTGSSLDSYLADIDQQILSIEHPAKKGSLPLDEEIQSYLDDHEELSDGDKQKLEKWIDAYQLDPEGTTKDITSEFSQFQAKQGATEVYGDTIGRLATATGMDATKIQDIFDKHGIDDPENLSNDQIALILPDLGGDALSKARDNVSKAQSALQSSIKSNTKAADKTNSDEDSLDFTPFRNLMDISKQSDAKSLALKDALHAEADAVAPILAALKGVPEEQVQALDGKKAGMLSVAGSDLNVVGNIRTGEIDLTSNRGAWPQVNLNTVKINPDSKSDDLPSWVAEEGYPVEGYTNEQVREGLNNGGLFFMDW